MAQKKTTPKDEATTVTRITATDTEAKKNKPAVTGSAPAKSDNKKPTEPKKKRSNIFVAIGGYFRGAWHELRQVRWPNRRTTWGLTFAVLVFSAFYVLLIILLDYGFNSVFEIILG